MDGHDGAFIDDAVFGHDALAVVRVDGKGGDDNGILLLRILHDVFLADDIHALHAPAFTDVELR